MTVELTFLHRCVSLPTLQDETSKQFNLPGVESPQLKTTADVNKKDCGVFSLSAVLPHNLSTPLDVFRAPLM